MAWGHSHRSARKHDAHEISTLRAQQHTLRSPISSSIARLLDVCDRGAAACLCLGRFQKRSPAFLDLACPSVIEKEPATLRPPHAQIDHNLHRRYPLWMAAKPTTHKHNTPRIISHLVSCRPPCSCRSVTISGCSLPEIKCCLAQRKEPSAKSQAVARCAQGARSPNPPSGHRLTYDPGCIAELACTRGAGRHAGGEKR